jgi:transposase
VAETSVEIDHRHTRPRSACVRGRDRYSHLACSFVWLLTSWAEGVLQSAKKQGHEHDTLGEHELGRHGTFDSYRENDNKEVFEAYIEYFLAPALKSGQVVMDNFSAHKGERVRRLIEDRGCQLLFLPLYSPDLDPIEEAFSKFKRLLRVIGARTKEVLVKAIGEALDAVCARDAEVFFSHCGYHGLA